MTSSTWTRPQILESDHQEQALAHLNEYFDGTKYTGSYFERVGGGGDREEVANVITSDDIVSLAMLSVGLDGRAARELLEGPVSSNVTELLQGLGPELDLVNPDHRKKLTAPGEEAEQLWKTVRKIKGMGPVRTSKLLARKRPNFFPVYDRLVGRAFGLKNDANQWQVWCEAMSDASLEKYLGELRTKAGLKDISLLRILDIIVWMDEKSG